MEAGNPSTAAAQAGGDAPAKREWPPAGFLDVSGTAAFFGISSGQLYDWIRTGRLKCRGTMAKGSTRAHGRIWAIADLEAARAEMANPEGWITGEEAAAFFGLTINVWHKWVASKRVPEGRWGHGPTGKRCLLFPLEGLERLKAKLEEEKAEAQRKMEPYPDPDRPGVLRVPVSSRKHPGMEAIIDAADLPLVQGKRWNWSPGRDDTATSRGNGGSVMWCGHMVSLPRVILGVTDPKLLVSHVNDDRLDCRRANLIARTRAEVRRSAKPPKRWEKGYDPYPDPDRPGVVRVPIQTRKHAGMEALIDAADLPLIEGKRWNWSPGKPDAAKDGTVVLVMTGTPKPSLGRILLGLEDNTKLVCHRNGDRLDCRRENLVIRTREQVRRGARKVLVKGGVASSSRFRGVSRTESGRKWNAAIKMDGKIRQLGRFRSEIDAALAYDAALRELMGEDAPVNLPDPEEIQRLRALEPVVEDGPWPPPGMVDRHEACAMFGVSTSAWMAWERKGLITCGEYHPNPDDSRGGRVKLYPKAELERARVEIEKLGKPYPDPELPGVWRVPLKSYLAHREVLIDEADLPIVQGRNWNWGPRSDDGRTEGVVLLATTGKQEHLHRLITGVTDPKTRVSFVNGDALDCRRENLAVRTLAEVAHTARKMEMRAGQECTSKFKGVYHDQERGRWVAQIRKGRVYLHIGRFHDEQTAAQAYDNCARVLFGPHAYVNLPDRESSEQDRVWAQRILDGTARQFRARKRKQRELERRLKRAMLEAKRAQEGAGGAARIVDEATPLIGPRTARKLFGVPRTVWRRWRRLGWLPATVMSGGRRRYVLEEIGRLLRACGRRVLPYPDPQLPGVYRLPLSGKTSEGREALIDADVVPLAQTRRWRFAPSNTSRGGEVQTMNPAENVRLHYVVLGIEAKADEFHIGFRNDDSLDCRRENLVVRTLTETAGNKRKQATFCGQPCTSRFKGVSWDRRRERWSAKIKKDRVTRWLGSFRDEIAAAQAYDEAARELFGEHARVNFPEGVDVWIGRQAA